MGERVREFGRDNPGAVGEPIPSRRHVLGLLVAATVVVQAPKYLGLLPALREWYLPILFFYYGITAIVPFLLARAAPGAAGFDRQWLPRSWWHWVWLFGMFVLLRACEHFSVWLTGLLAINVHWHDLVPASVSSVTPTFVVLNGVVFVLLGPIAEEIFWRGYALEQLRKLTWSGVALLIHALAFALAHLHKGPLFAVAALLIGTVLGIWRIRFRSLVPLIIAHMLVNAIANAAYLKDHFALARSWSKPECRQIDLLTKEPIDKAVPGIIGYFAHPDLDVRIYAEMTLVERYRGHAEPYLRPALRSRDKNTLDGALFVVQMSGYSSLAQEVRDVVWTADDPWTQLSATSALGFIRDSEGLRQIAKAHPSEKVRAEAEHMLSWLAAEE